jgi:Periplasmic binding protein domain
MWQVASRIILFFGWEYDIGFWVLSNPHHFPPKMGDAPHPCWEMLRWTTFFKVGLPLLIGSLFFAAPLGVVRAVQAAGATGKIMVVSVDGTPEAVDALKQGLLTGTVAQYPDAMAYMAIETMVKKLNGETVPEKISSPIKLITKDNVSDAGKYYKDE